MPQIGVRSWPVALNVFFAALAVCFAPLVAQARLDPQPVLVSLAAGKSTRVIVRGFCLDYGDPFPGPELDPGSLAADDLRLALSYSLEKGYAETQAWQVQLAIWYLNDDQWHATDHALADEIVAHARSGATPPDVGLEGTPLPQAIAAGQVSVSIVDFRSISSPAYHGEGTLALTNLGGEALTVHFPYGTVFTAEEPRNAQRMLVYVMQEVAEPPTVTPTVTDPAVPPTDTPTPTATAIVPPSTDTPTPTATVLLPPSGGARPLPGGGWAAGLVASGVLLLLGGWLLARRQA